MLHGGALRAACWRLRDVTADVAARCMYGNGRVLRGAASPALVWRRVRSDGFVVLVDGAVLRGGVWQLRDVRIGVSNPFVI